ncbi:MAG: hypothetical protein N2257_02675 [Thermodesulfovibrionales bacterium]|nr:hypothetical protein [Thermodesulfovibrionales bacterium]
MTYLEGKKLEKRLKELLALYNFQNLNDEQRARAEHEIELIKNILPAEVVEEIEHYFSDKNRLSKEEKEAIYKKMEQRLKEHPNWADFHLFDLFFDILSVRDGELLNKARNLRWEILNRRPIPLE